MVRTASLEDEERYGRLTRPGSPHRPAWMDIRLDDPAELAGDVGQDDQDVEIALVVGHEDLRFAAQNIFLADYFHFCVAD